MRLFDFAPDADVLLSLQPPDIGQIALRLAFALRTGNGLIHPTVLEQSVDRQPGDDRSAYPENRKQEIKQALEEGVAWLVSQGLLVAEFGQGNNGWMRISRAGHKLLQDDNFADYKRAAAFPRGMLHPRIAELVWGDLAAGNYDQAVFKAFREVEIAVRDAGNFEPSFRAVQVMRLAFGPQGTLADPDGVPSEVEALRELFSGAIGSYKNPHSHRTVNIQEVVEAQEMVVLASHLLRIVETRRAQQQQNRCQ
jgi:uncharacterized protein (TIGR02391 family)